MEVLIDVLNGAIYLAGILFIFSLVVAFLTALRLNRNHKNDDMKTLIFAIALGATLLSACTSPTANDIEPPAEYTYMYGYISDTNLDRNPILFTWVQEGSNKRNIDYIYGLEFDKYTAREYRYIYVKYDGQKWTAYKRGH